MSTQYALVTGGSGGIGTEICVELAASGFRILALDHPSRKEHLTDWLEQINQRANTRVDLCFADVGEFDSCLACAEEIIDQYDSPTVLVNGAGITRDTTLRKMDKHQWDDVLRTNLDSVFNVTRQFIEPMVEKGFGRIINISSVSGQSGQFGQTNYAAAKAGMHGFTKALAQELASKGITVNTISPGYVATAMVEAIREDIRADIVKQIPVGRLAQPAEIARVVSFLSDENSGYITGANIDINGGLWMH